MLLFLIMMGVPFKLISKKKEKKKMLLSEFSPILYYNECSFHSEMIIKNPISISDDYPQ